MKIILEEADIQAVLIEHIQGNSLINLKGASPEVELVINEDNSVEAAIIIASENTTTAPKRTRRKRKTSTAEVKQQTKPVETNTEESVDEDEDETPPFKADTKTESDKPAIQEPANDEPVQAATSKSLFG